MSDLRIETLKMPGAEVGPENPFPALGGPVDVHATLEVSPDIPAEDQKHVGWGQPPGCLPYRVQDGYRRKKRSRRFRVAVLENEALRATFLLELGGRLHSLVHKATGRELLEANPVFQPANLAIRNAWFSGGVEWNIGMIGHCPFTCSPLFAARVDGPGGTPVLRLYEWERIRRVPFQIDAYLPDGSPVLFVRVRITNPNRVEVPMYWWSNMSVPETPDTRVLAPVDHAYRLAYGHGLQKVGVPIWEGKDASYTTNLDRAMDFFFRIPDGHRPWIAALDGKGQGLVQTSTDRLKGRKLFLWGQGVGGKRWQEFLSQPGHAYLEIQAGLARTQAEHLPMPAGAEWSWLEAYGLMQADPRAVHGKDWAVAHSHVEGKLETLIPRRRLEEEFEQGRGMADLPPAEIIQRGSGWGALENRRRKRAGEPPCCSPALVFDETTLGPEQAPWIALLETGAMPAVEPEKGPNSFMVQSEWKELLESRARQGGAASWAEWLHLGVMRGYAGDLAGARQALEKSLEACRTAWALRCLAVLHRIEKNPREAADSLEQALLLRPALARLAAECGQTMIEAGCPQRWLHLVDGLPAAVRRNGRIVVIEARAALAAGELDRVDKILRHPPTVDDMLEGEVSLTDLWFGLNEQRLSQAEGKPVDDALKARVRRDFPPPREIDFRMVT